LLGGGLYRYKHQQLDQAPTQVAVAVPSQAPTAQSEETKPNPDPIVESEKIDEQPAPELSPPPVVLPSVPKKHQKPAQMKAIPSPDSDSASTPALDEPETKAPSVAPPVEAPSLSGSWQGEYNHPGAKQSYKVSLQLSEGATDVLSGILIFDPDGSNASSCSLSGHYNPQTKFMLLIIGTCHGNPPDYLQGKIGFGSVDPSDQRVMGVDQMHDGVLNISR
jgi:hypothetical protein